MDALPLQMLFYNKKNFVKAWNKKITTSAHGISDALTGYAEDGTQTLNTIYLSKGAGVKVSDREIHDAKKVSCQAGRHFCGTRGCRWRSSSDFHDER
jgi:hypothetical protein